MPDYSDLVPANLKPGLTTPDGANLKPSLVTPSYAGGTPAAAGDIKPSLRDSAGNLKPSLTNGGALKASLSSGSQAVSRIIGKQTDGGTGPSNLTQDYLWVTGTYQPANDGSIQSISLFTNEAGIGVKLCVYEDSGGLPGSLIAETTELVSLAGGWITGNASGNLSAAKSYWIGWVHNVTGMLMAYDATKSTRYVAQAYASGPANPFPGGSAALTREYPAYVTYLG